MDELRPAFRKYAVDSTGKVGRVTGRYLGSVYLRPPGGGKEWSVPPEELREPTEAELARIRVFTTPVQAVPQ
ncbi:hypothetical protein [Streptomyces sp. NPDC048350]|uniref:hypothetical protein n=1 Tax=Streptomyces sp. NPDC048350 TaxID=3365538 RepID=UPI003721B6F7